MRRLLINGITRHGWEQQSICRPASRAAAEALLDAALASRGSGRHRRQHEPVEAGEGRFTSAGAGT